MRMIKVRLVMILAGLFLAHRVPAEEAREGATAGVHVEHLRCEYRENPLGIDALQPRLSWQLRSTERGQRQRAYRLLVASSPALLQREQGDLWDSGRVDSDQSINVRYAGKPLTAREQCFWKVRAWDKDDQPGAWSPMGTWEIGLPVSNDWAGAKWIRLAKDTRHSPLTRRAVQTQTMTRPRMAEAFAAPLFRREFPIKPGVVRARAYVCGLGYNELYVNGQRCGDAVLDPAQTTYDVRAFYVTHDITQALKVGTNAVGVLLGNGFFGQNQAFNAPGLGYAAPTLIARIVIDYADGTTETLSTDAAWKAETGPVLYDNVYGGESYDARLEKEGWNAPGFDDSTWEAALPVAAPTARLQAQMLPPVGVCERVPVQQVFAGEKGKWIFDLGRNLAGWARLKVKAPAGTQLTLRFAEALKPGGKTLNFETTGVLATGLEQTDIYVCKGGGVESWAPRFTYHGFRYVEVSGLLEPPAPELLEGMLVHTAVAEAGSFACSDPVLNRIYRTSLWTIEDNMHGVMEDCPHREKCGWLGDAHSVAETTIFNYDMAQFWTKFVDDIGTTLGRGGATYWGQPATPGIPCNIAVGKRLCQEARPDWGAAYVLLPWYLYSYYGDMDVFARHYEHLKDWIDYVRGLREHGIVTRGYGDWCPPGGNANMECPVPLTSTAVFYGTLVIMEQFAQQLGKAEDAATFARMAAETKAAFNREFFNLQSGGYGSQTADAVAMRFGLYPEGQRNRVADALVHEIVERHGGHAFVGIHGAKALFTQLADTGHADVAIAALEQKTWPSYAYALAQGFTTWPEQFNEKSPKERPTNGSLNHPMQSGFASWFHESLGGMRPASPGFKRIELAPHGYQQLAWVTAQHESPYGPIVSRWRSASGSFEWEISIPANTTATVSVPARNPASVLESGREPSRSPGVAFLRYENGRAVYQVDSGTYRFNARL